MRWFFDSWGGLWEVCEADLPEAMAFGPCGCARRVEVDHVLPACRTPWAIASDAGYVEHDEVTGWDWVRPELLEAACCREVCGPPEE